MNTPSRISRQATGLPLTDMIVEMMGASTARLQAMDVERVAKHYGVRVAFVESYRNDFLRIRGTSVGKT